ncbi:MAG: hypothetical protein CML03_13125 [Pseudooceanicola sp.]|nr:hypothetical protein [Pseudooceanicola sp.]|tara:strand:- start:167 stop:1093 length:927 start_codon:yes stop_codon:yes gene_type:complete
MDGPMRQFCLCVLFLICATSGALAQEGRLSYLGSGRLFVNDMIGDGDDRWRTGSISVSHVFGPGWRGQLPERPGEIIEVRVMGEVIAPYRLNRRNAGDRPFAGSWSLGAHSHFQRGGWQMSLGADAVITGPQTGLANLQQFLHRTVGFDHKASPSVLAGQIPNGIHAAGVFETGRDYAVGRAILRPFVEARAGVEDLARVGFDLTFGSVGRRELMIRDTVTGIRYRTIGASEKGHSLVLGADAAKVWHSIYLPSGRNQITDLRYRARAGLHWQGNRWRQFFGLTWLGPEFVGQRSGQVVGAVRFDYRF